MKRVGAIAVGAVIGALPATAQISHPAPNAMFEILSNGQDSCGEFLAGGQSHQVLDAMWILGYITGADSRGVTVSDRAVGTSFRDGGGVIAWLQQCCRQHGLNVMVAAAEALRDEFARREGRR